MVDMSRMLSEILEATLRSRPDFEVVARYRHQDELSSAVLDSGADLVIAGCDAVDEAEFGRLLRERPKAKVLAVLGDGQRSYLYQLRAHSVALGEMSPQSLLTVLASVAAGCEVNEHL